MDLVLEVRLRQMGSVWGEGAFHSSCVVTEMFDVSLVTMESGHGRRSGAFYILHNCLYIVLASMYSDCNHKQKHIIIITCNFLKLILEREKHQFVVPLSYAFIG